MLHSYRTSVHTNLRSRTFGVYNQNKLSQLQTNSLQRQVQQTSCCRRWSRSGVSGGKAELVFTSRSKLFL